MWLTISRTKISTSAISIARVIALHDLSQSDITWNLVPLELYSTLEIDTGLICSCLPVMAPLLHLVTGNRFGSSQDRLSAHNEYKAGNSNQSSKLHRARRATDEDFSILREESAKDTEAGGANEVYTGPTGELGYIEHEVHVGATGHELDEMGHNSDGIYVTRGIDIER